MMKAAAAPVLIDPREPRQQLIAEPTMKRKPDYEKSSGNVFADLGFRNSKQELLKAKLTVQIYKLLKGAWPDAAPGGKGAGRVFTTRPQAVGWLSPPPIMAPGTMAARRR